MIRMARGLDEFVKRLCRRTDGQHPELRLAMLNTMREKPLLIGAAVFWTQAAYLIIFLSLRNVWLALPAGLDLAGACIRLRFGRERRRRDDSIIYSYDLNILTLMLWILLIAIEVFLLLRIRDVEAVVMGTIIGVGFLGYVTARCAAFPGIAVVMIGVLTLAITSGFLTSPFALVRLGLMAPAAGIAFGILMMHVHETLIEAIRAKHENRQRSLHDPLTGLPNRLLMEERLADLCQRRLRKPAGPNSFAVLCLDLDGFKQVNDRFGHAAGDEVLIAVSKMLAAGVADDGIVCRIGGDEFVIVLPSADRRTAAEVADRLVEAVSRPFSLVRGVKAQVGATIGAALYPQNGTSPDSLLSNADDALYEAKRAGRGRWMFATSVPGPVAIAAE